MIPARKEAWLTRGFQWYVRRYLRASFHRVLVRGALPPRPTGPVVVCLNHSSWWDLLLGFWLAQDVLGWDAYAPMDERQLRRYPLLERVGVFGVDRESLQGSREFLAYAEALLKGTSRSIWLTPQGALLSNDVRPIRFYSGAARLAGALENCSMLTIALDFEFWDERRPEALVSIGPLEPVPRGCSSRALLRRWETTLETEMDALATARHRRDASLFRVALESPGGISPVYDVIRRFSAVTNAGRARSGRPSGQGPRSGPAEDVGRSRTPAAGHQSEHGATRSAPRWGPARDRTRNGGE